MENNKKANVSSPLIPNGSTLFIEKFNKEKILDLYSELGLDVSRFFKKTSISLYKCSKTGYRFFYPPSIIGDASFYAELSKTKKNYYSHRWEHFKSLEFLKKNDKVLEIGSGFGSYLEMLREKEIRAQGIELNEHAVKICKSKDLDVRFKRIEQITEENKECFDVVCSFQVLEHIYEVHDFIKNQLQILKVGGKLIIGVPNNNPYLFISDKYHTLNLPPHHAGLWDKKSLLALEKVFSLKVEEIIFEPISLSYNYFLNYNIKRIKSYNTKKVFWKLEKISRPFLIKLISKLFKGRNILVIYRKL